MKISIIGQGNVGWTLGSRLASAGHTITFGVRDPEKAGRERASQSTLKRITFSNVEKAIDATPVIVLAIPYSAALNLMEAHPPGSGKVIIDCSNPAGPGMKLSVGHDTSGAEQIAARAGGSSVVKAFNTTGFENMRRPLYGDGSLTMFICGDDAHATKTAAALAQDLGFEPCVTGPLYHARYLEPLAMLWIDMAMRQKRGRGIGFRLLSR